MSSEIENWCDAYSNHGNDSYTDLHDWASWACRKNYGLQSYDKYIGRYKFITESVNYQCSKVTNGERSDEDIKVAVSCRAPRDFKKEFIKISYPSTTEGRLLSEKDCNSWCRGIVNSENCQTSEITCWSLPVKNGF
jgi:hypothetical protein